MHTPNESGRAGLNDIRRATMLEVSATKGKTTEQKDSDNSNDADNIKNIRKRNFRIVHHEELPSNAVQQFCLESIAIRILIFGSLPLFEPCLCLKVLRYKSQTHRNEKPGFLPTFCGPR